MPDKYNTEKEPVQLCTPVIYSSIKSIRKNYHDYTIITVMHRNPSEFTWVTRNRVEPNKPDILRFLYQYSDIILTGHEHIEKVLPPHKMENHAQLFQLGSASVKSRNNNEINHYLASLIHIDPVDGSINLCNFENDGMNVAWGAKVDPNTYPLAHHDSIIPFESIADLGWYGKKMSFDTMPVKSFEKNDMIQALRNRFVGMERAGYIISCLSINDSDLLDGINRIRLKGDKNAIFIYTLSVPDHKMFMSFLKNILSVDSVRVDIYLKKLILSEVRFTYHDPDVNLA